MFIRCLALIWLPLAWLISIFGWLIPIAIAVYVIIVFRDVRDELRAIRQILEKERRAVS